MHLIIASEQLHDGSKGTAEPTCDLYDKVVESENPEYKRSAIYVEHVLRTGSILPKCVEEELHFGSFATTDCSDRLRSPQAKNPEVTAAMRAVGRTMPVRYGHNYGKLSLTDENVQKLNEKHRRTVFRSRRQHVAGCRSTSS